MLGTQDMEREVSSFYSESEASGSTSFQRKREHWSAAEPAEVET